MPDFKIKKGLDIPIGGAVESLSPVSGPVVRKVALKPADYPGIKVKLLAKEGQTIARGEPLFADRRDEAVIYTAPGGGRVAAVNRGERRRILSVVIEIESTEEKAKFEPINPDSAGRDGVRALLLKSGLWPCIRRRPFNSVARSDETPSSIFVTAMDTSPLAAPASALLAGREEDFRSGVKILSKLTECPTYLCTREGDESPAFEVSGKVRRRTFAGPHPAGNAGVHINALDPVGPDKFVWHVGFQDAAAIGQLFRTGVLPASRNVAIAGPAAKNRGIFETRRGASMDDLARDVIASQPARVISGSVLSGLTANPGTPEGFLGAYDNQVTIIPDESPQVFLGWDTPGASKYSVTNTFLGRLIRCTFDFSTSMEGSLRAVVPIGVYEKVMPMDIMPTFLIKALASDDIEEAEKLGVLELAEEDMALLGFVCPSKIDISGLLRKMLVQMEKEDYSAAASKSPCEDSCKVCSAG